MPRRIAEKCRLCAKLSTEQAKLTHGPTGDNCWAGQRCHQRRSHYKNQTRTNPERKRKRLALQALAQLSKIAPTPPANEEHTAGDKRAPLTEPQPDLTKPDFSDSTGVALAPAPLPTPLPTTLPPATTTAPATPEPVTTLHLPPPGTAAAFVHWYRERKDAPLHALSAELWLGGRKVAVLHPVHTLGATETDVRRVLLRVLEQFSGVAGKPISQFRGAVELHPGQCPIRPCPLHPTPGLSDDVEHVHTINL